MGGASEMRSSMLAGAAGGAEPAFGAGPADVSAEIASRRACKSSLGVTGAAAGGGALVAGAEALAGVAVSGLPCAVIDDGAHFDHVDAGSGGGAILWLPARCWAPARPEAVPWFARRARAWPARQSRPCLLGCQLPGAKSSSRSRLPASLPARRGRRASVPRRACARSRPSARPGRAACACARCARLR